MKKTFLCAVFTLTFSLCAFSQTTKTNNVVGINHSILSEILKEKREIQVFLPDSYAGSEKKYPVLYILDGQRLFLHGVSVQKSLVQFKQTPEFIVVGVSSVENQRAQDFIRGSDKFLDFLEREVIGFVDKNYRTSKERLIYGWAFGGGLVLEALTAKPALFEAYIAASPFPVSGRIKKTEELLSDDKELDKFFFFTTGANEGSVTEGTDQLRALMTAKAPEEFSWTHLELEEEVHRSTAFTTLFHGLTGFYDSYPELQIDDLDEFLAKGGAEYARSYYAQRAKSFGFSPAIAEWTMFTIVRSAMRADNYVQFDRFVNEFKGNDLIGRLSLNRGVSIGEFYLKHKKYRQAEGIFEFLHGKNPESVRVMTRLGDVYKGLGNDKKADEYYKKANVPESKTEARGVAYIDSARPGLKPKIFAPGFISKKDEYEFGSVFSKDGKEFFYAVDTTGKAEIRTTRLHDGSWTKPAVIISDDKYGFNDPFLSNDGERLYYISEMPRDSKDSSKDIDIWYSKRTGDSWSKPINAGDKINSTKNEYYISFAADNSMYFSSNKNHEGKRAHDFDIYRSAFVGGLFQTPEKLSAAINTRAYEADVFVAPDESYVIFVSARRSGLGNGDLYISFKDSDGNWTEAKNMGDVINSKNHEICPFVTADGKYFFYTSNQDIYWVSTDVFEKMRGSNGE